MFTNQPAFNSEDNINISNLINEGFIVHFIPANAVIEKYGQESINLKSVYDYFLTIKPEYVKHVVVGDDKSNSIEAVIASHEEHPMNTGLTLTTVQIGEPDNYDDIRQNKGYQSFVNQIKLNTYESTDKDK